MWGSNTNDNDIDRRWIFNGRQNSRFAHSLMIAMTRSVDTSCALANRRLASRCKSFFNILLAKWSSLRLMTVVWDTWGSASNFTFSSCTSLGIFFFVATLMAVEMSVRFSHAKSRECTIEKVSSEHTINWNNNWRALPERAFDLALLQCFSSWIPTQCM